MDRTGTECIKENRHLVLFISKNNKKILASAKNPDVQIAFWKLPLKDTSKVAPLCQSG